MTENSRESLIAQRLDDRLGAICKAVPPIRPPAAFWLDSDAGPSYCRACAEKARAAEMGLAEVPQEPDKFTWNYTDEDERVADLLEEFKGGIDGGFDTQSDSPEACTTCGQTLSYILTDYGVESEIDYYCEAPLANVSGETSYALDRLALNIWAGAPRDQILGVAISVNQAWRLLPTGVAK